MPDDHSLADLARLADVTPRTVRYYVAQGLLPSPDAAGPATRYSDGHLARLRLIRRMQRDHLPLAEIRERLERISDQEVIQVLASISGGHAVGGGPALDDAAAYVNRLMEQARISPTVHPMPGPTPPPLASRPAVARSLERADVAAAPSPPPVGPEPGFPADVPYVRSQPRYQRSIGEERPPSLASRTTWERLVITPDVEIHVRRPLKPVDNKRVDILERRARELFQDEP